MNKNEGGYITAHGKISPKLNNGDPFTNTQSRGDYNKYSLSRLITSVSTYTELDDKLLLAIKSKLKDKKSIIQCLELLKNYFNAISDEKKEEISKVINEVLSGYVHIPYETVMKKSFYGLRLTHSDIDSSVVYQLKPDLSNLDIFHGFEIKAKCINYLKKNEEEPNCLISNKECVEKIYKKLNEFFIHNSSDISEETLDTKLETQSLVIDSQTLLFLQNEILLQGKGSSDLLKQEYSKLFIQFITVAYGYNFEQYIDNFSNPVLERFMNDFGKNSEDFNTIVSLNKKFNKEKDKSFDYGNDIKGFIAFLYENDEEYAVKNIFVKQLSEQNIKNSQLLFSNDLYQRIDIFIQLKTIPKATLELLLSDYLGISIATNSLNDTTVGEIRNLLRFDPKLRISSEEIKINSIIGKKVVNKLILQSLSPEVKEKLLQLLK